MRYYLSGPMSGIKDFNAERFTVGAALLRAEGHEVWSPYENDVKRYGVVKSRNGSPDDVPGFDKDAVAMDDVMAIRHSEAIAMLPGWEYSGGCFGEWAMAKWLRRKFRYISQDELDRFERCQRKSLLAI